MGSGVNGSNRGSEPGARHILFNDRVKVTKTCRPPAARSVGGAADTGMSGEHKHGVANEPAGASEPAGANEPCSAQIGPKSSPDV